MYSSIGKKALTLYYIKATTVLIILWILYAFTYNFTKEFMILYIGVLFIITLFVMVYTLILYKHYKYKIVDDIIIVKCGYIVKKKYISPLSRVQQIELKQNFIQRLLSLSTIRIVTAGSFGSIKNIDHKVALKINSNILNLLSREDLNEE